MVIDEGTTFWGTTVGTEPGSSDNGILTELTCAYDAGPLDTQAR